MIIVASQWSLVISHWSLGIKQQKTKKRVTVKSPQTQLV